MTEPDQQPTMDDRHHLLKTMLRYTWYKPVLRALGAGPTRYVDLARNVKDRDGNPPAESQLNLALKGLGELQLVEKEDLADVRARWRLTEQGHVALQDLGYLERVQRARDLNTTLTRDSPSGLPALDPDVPHPARRYNYWLGGKDHFAADRRSADDIEALAPGMRAGVRENREFLRRVVRYLAAEQGVRQFLDIGTGLPTADNTHDVAQTVAPDSKVIYVDNDPIVLSHARALLTSAPEGTTEYIEADVREPDQILHSEAVRNTLDLSQPVAVLLVAVLHFVHGQGAAKPIVQRLMRELPRGSYLVVSHGTKDLSPSHMVEAQEEMRRQGRSDFWLRTREEVADLFEGLDIIEPGVVPVTKWRPSPTTPDLDLHLVATWAGVGYKTR